MAKEVSCFKCGHPVTVIDGERIICPNCQENEAVKALFAAPAAAAETAALPAIPASGGGRQLMFVCPFCSETYPVSAELAGKKINCRNCYEPSRAPGKEKKAAPPAEAAPWTDAIPSSDEPWFYAFAEQFANAGMLIGGGACVAGCLIALALFRDKEAPALFMALGFVAAFFVVVGSMAAIRVIVHAMRQVARHDTAERKSH